MHKSVNLDWDGGIFQNDGDLDIDLKISKVTLGLTGFSDVNVRLGFTTGLDGSFDTFTFGQESNTTVHIRDEFSVYIDWPDPFGSSNISLISSLVTVRPASKVRSTTETLGVGTRIDEPSSLPFSSGMTRPSALAAPVEVGIIDMAAARAR